MPKTIRIVPAIRSGVICSPKMRTLRMAVTRGYVAAMGTISDVAPAFKAAKYVIIPMSPASMPLMLKITTVFKSTVKVSLIFPVKSKNKKSATITAILLMVIPVKGWTLANPIFSMIGVLPQRIAVRSNNRRILIIFFSFLRGVPVSLYLIYLVSGEKIFYFLSIRLIQ